MATDDVKLGRAIYRLAEAIGELNQQDVDREAVTMELNQALRYLAAVDRGKLAATELPYENEGVGVE